MCVHPPQLDTIISRGVVWRGHWASDCNENYRLRTLCAIVRAVRSSQRLCATPQAEAEGQYVASTLGTAFGAGGGPRSELRDHTKQRPYYESKLLHDKVDVGLLWRPGNQKVGGAFGIRNRPPTRMHWWWSHGVPTLGYPMVAYTEGAARAGYPAELLNVSRTTDLPAALCAVSSSETRSCLRAAALRGAAVTSPQYSALELVAALCGVAKTCAPGGELRRFEASEEREKSAASDVIVSFRR